jgi:tRNA (guanine37-N1)-methyltransferase
MRVFEKAAFKAFLLTARRRAHYPGKQPDASVQQSERGRFEGFDERIFEARALEPVSVGDYVLSGGELGAMVVLDACVRLLPGVMGAASSGEEESFEQALLEYPHYTRPVQWEGRTIPEVLRSGDHAKIAAWRRERAIEDTRLRRPDLIERHGGASQAPPSGAQRDRDEKKT